MTDLKKKEYNDIPVYYCKHCLSLAVKGLQNTDEFNYCSNCGSLDIEECSIEEWEELYKKAHGGRRYLSDNY